MKVLLSNDALQEEGCWPDLDHIARRIDRGAHEWRVEDPDTMMQSEWLRKGRDHLRELLEKTVARDAYPTIHKRCVTVTIHPDGQNPWELKPLAAADFLDQPLVILVENEMTDALFLKAVIRTLGSKAFREYCRDAPHVMDCKGAGGIGEIPKHIDKQRENAKKAGVPLRLIVLADSDGTVPGEVSPTAQTVQKMCDENGIPCCVLKKRAIENYIPDEIFKTWSSAREQSNKRPQVEALLRLTPAQRDHFPMKKGFPTAPTSEERALYDSVVPQDQVILKKPLTELVPLLETYAQSLSPEGLRHRAGDRELDRLVEMIVAEI